VEVPLSSLPLQSRLRCYVFHRGCTTGEYISPVKRTVISHIIYVMREDLFIVVTRRIVSLSARRVIITIDHWLTMCHAMSSNSLLNRTSPSPRQSMMLEKMGLRIMDLRVSIMSAYPGGPVGTLSRDTRNRDRQRGRPLFFRERE